MADKDNKELMEFLGKQFEGIDKQFEGIHKQFEGIDKQFEGVNKRLDNTATKDDIEEVKRHTGVLIEAIEHKIDIVVEGVMAVNERLDRRTEENEKEHAQLDKRMLINTADISGLDLRVGRLEKA